MNASPVLVVTIAQLQLLTSLSLNVQRVISAFPAPNIPTNFRVVQVLTTTTAMLSLWSFAVIVLVVTTVVLQDSLNQQACVEKAGTAASVLLFQLPSIHCMEVLALLVSIAQLALHLPLHALKECFVRQLV